MNVTFEKVENPYSQEVFELTKTGLFPFVDEVFGWDDDFQKQRMRNDYQSEWFFWAIIEGTRVGYVCFKRYEQAIHLHLIIIDQIHQRKGYGRAIMQAIQSIAFKEKRDVTLSSFKCNELAVKLYKELGYEVEKEEEHFLIFRLQYGRSHD